MSEDEHGSSERTVETNHEQPPAGRDDQSTDADFRDTIPRVEHEEASDDAPSRSIDAQKWQNRLDELKADLEATQTEDARQAIKDKIADLRLRMQQAGILEDATESAAERGNDSDDDSPADDHGIPDDESDADSSSEQEADEESPSGGKDSRNNTGDTPRTNPPADGSAEATAETDSSRPNGLSGLTQSDDESGSKSDSKDSLTAIAGSRPRSGSRESETPDAESSSENEDEQQHEATTDETDRAGGGGESSREARTDERSTDSESEPKPISPSREQTETNGLENTSNGHQPNRRETTDGDDSLPEEVDSDEHSEPTSRSTQDDDSIGHAPDAVEQDSQPDSKPAAPDGSDGGTANAQGPSEALTQGIDDLAEELADVESRLGSLETTFEEHQRKNERQHEVLRKEGVEELAERMLRVRDTLTRAIKYTDWDEDQAAMLEAVVEKFDQQFTAGAIEIINPDRGDEVDHLRHALSGSVADANVPEECIVRAERIGFEVDGYPLKEAEVVVVDGE